MSRLESLRDLYKRFDRAIARPSVLHTEGCCVSRKQATSLVESKREELNEYQLSHLFQHYGICCGSFREVAYFVPRMLEIIGNSQGGSEDVHRFWPTLHGDRETYRRLQLWQGVVDTISDILRDRTEVFCIEHFDASACRLKGWALAHCDIVVAGGLINELVGDFFFPEYSATPEKWEEFFIQWADDENPHRVAHLLEFLKQKREWPSLYNVELPPSFSARLDNEDYFLDLVGRIEPIVPLLQSPTWLNDLLTAFSQSGGS